MTMKRHSGNSKCKSKCIGCSKVGQSKTVKNITKVIKTRQTNANSENGNKNIYAKRSENKSKCRICGQVMIGRLMVSHYVKNHPNSEVLISRLSPKMAKNIRDQSARFRFERAGVNTVVAGLCYFCGEEKMFQKSYWLTHLCKHTGEQLFHCTKCDMKMTGKENHKCSRSEIEIIYEGSEQFDRRRGWSISGYMCNECNYLQLTKSKLEHHIKNEHIGFKATYKKLVLVKDPSIFNSCEIISKPNEEPTSQRQIATNIDNASENNSNSHSSGTEMNKENDVCALKDKATQNLQNLKSVSDAKSFLLSLPMPTIHFSNEKQTEKDLNRHESGKPNENCYSDLPTQNSLFDDELSSSIGTAATMENEAGMPDENIESTMSDLLDFVSAMDCVEVEVISTLDRTFIEEEVNNVEQSEDLTGREKNIDKKYYAGSEKEKKCQICGEFNENIVNHYVQNHPDYEIFSSRLLPETAENLRNIKPFVQQGDSIFINAFCVFCRYNHTFKKNEWLLHFSSKTGEYFYSCVACKIKMPKKGKHCMQPKKISPDFDKMLKKDIFGFICTHCNYIQLSECNVINHLRSEHGFTHGIQSHYTKRPLLPLKNKHSAYQSTPGRSVKSARSLQMRATSTSQRSKNDKIDQNTENGQIETGTTTQKHQNLRVLENIEIPLSSSYICNQQRPLDMQNNFTPLPLLDINSSNEASSNAWGTQQSFNHQICSSFTSNESSENALLIPNTKQQHQNSNKANQQLFTVLAYHQPPVQEIPFMEMVSAPQLAANSANSEQFEEVMGIEPEYIDIEQFILCNRSGVISCWSN